MASLLDDPASPGAPDTNPVSAALGDLYRKVTGYMTKQPEMAFRYADNPVGTETTQSIGMPAPTTYAGAVGQYVNPATGQLTDQGRQRLADNPLLGFDTGGVSPVSGLLGALKGYHGSPHAFDRFSNEAIGTGEGAQAYGYGHYLADSEGVARSYRDALGPAADPKVQAAGAEFNAAHAAFDGSAEARARVDAAERALQAAERTAAPGHMYEVNVAAEPEHFLDWDKPLSEQHPKVIEALNKTPYPPSDMRMPVKQYLAELETNREMATREGDPAALAAHALHQAGIPGIRYLDAGSRGAGEGSRNTVVFDPTTMDIIRRYGVAGLLGGAAAAGSRVGADDGRQEQ
jgi:hypothetical protein